MKTFRSVLFAFAVGLVFAGLPSRTAQANPGVSFEFFYNHLEPYGEWIEVGDYGYCWHPSGVDDGWRPYADGYWAQTDSGWTWVSYEDFGWITYHYGRWSYVRDIGWLWRPDYQWAPAWVSWRHGGDYVGWAPLPFGCDFRPHVGIGFWVDSYHDIGPDYYNFCPVAYFGSPYLRPVILDRRRNFTIIQNTVNITNITVNNNNIYVGGPSYKVLAAKSKRPIPVLKLDRVSDEGIGKGDKHLAKAQDGKLMVNAPVIDPPKDKIKPDKLAKKIDQPKIDKGWDMVKGDEKQKEKFHEKLKAEAKGLKPEDKPAKPVSDSELKIVSDKSKGHDDGQPAVDGGKVGKQKNKEGQPVVETPMEKGGKHNKSDTTTPLEPFTGNEPKTGKDKGDKHDKHNKPLEPPVTIPDSGEKKGKHDTGQPGKSDDFSRKQEKEKMKSQEQDEQRRKHQEDTFHQQQSQQSSKAKQAAQQQDEVLRQQQKQMQKQQQQPGQTQHAPSKSSQDKSDGKDNKKGKPTPSPN